MNKNLVSKRIRAQKCERREADGRWKRMQSRLTDKDTAVFNGAIKKKATAPKR